MDTARHVTEGRLPATPWPSSATVLLTQRGLAGPEDEPKAFWAAVREGGPSGTIAS